MMENKEMVNNPEHYGGVDNPYEVIKVIHAWDLGFDLGNTVKYISRAGKKDPQKELEDLKKAAWYLNHHIKMIEGKMIEGTNTLLTTITYDNNVIELHVNPKYGNADMHRAHGNHRLLEQLVDATKGFTLITKSESILGGRVYDTYIGGNNKFTFIGCDNTIKIWANGKPTDYFDKDYAYIAYINT